MADIASIQTSLLTGTYLETAGSRKLNLGVAAFDPTQGQEVSKNLTEYRAATSHDNVRASE
jgi:hypothetical protein